MVCWNKESLHAPIYLQEFINKKSTLLEGAVQYSTVDAVDDTEGEVKYTR